jgi:hypothetical protein
MGSGGSASRDDWLHAYESAYYALPRNAHIPCPNCGEDALRLAFIGDEGEPIGYVFFWCDHCLLGLHLDRVDIPQGVDVLPRDVTPAELAERVPAFSFVMPDADPPGPAARGASRPPTE